MALTAKVVSAPAAAGTKRAPVVIRSVALQQRIRPANSSSVSQVTGSARSAGGEPTAVAALPLRHCCLHILFSAVRAGPLGAASPDSCAAPQNAFLGRSFSLSQASSKGATRSVLVGAGAQPQIQVSW
jgi:hypothetical protein